MSIKHDKRLNELIATSKKLFFSKSYEKTTVADIIDEIGIAKGTFYHYFKSKEDLLDKMIEVFFAETESSVNEVFKSDMSPLNKLERIFRVIRDVKIDNYELIITLMEFMYDQKNILFREKLNRYSMEFLTPILNEVISAGIKDGSFRTFDPETASEIILNLFLGYGQQIGKMWTLVAGSPEIALVIEKKLDYLVNAVERILGIPENSIEIVDRKIIEYFKTKMNKVE